LPHIAIVNHAGIEACVWHLQHQNHSSKGR